MKLEFKPFNDAISLVSCDPTDRASIVTTALAFSASKHSSMPSNKVEDTEAFFNSTILPTITDFLSDWNENIIFSFREALVIARAFWMIRYNALYPEDGLPFLQTRDGFFDKAFLVQKYMSETQHDLTDKYADEIIKLVFVIGQIITQCNKDNCVVEEPIETQAIAIPLPNTADPVKDFS